VNVKKCHYCAETIALDAVLCRYCGRPQVRRDPEVISLKDSLLFCAILLLVALAVAPVWPGDQIYGRSIAFLAQSGILLPGSTAEAARYRDLMMNIVQLYQGLNVLHYIMIVVFILLFASHWLRTHKQMESYTNRVWIVLGLLLLIFPAVNLVISWNMFLTTGVIGTLVASLVVVLAGLLR
jgi:hypothetical protein